MQESCARQLAPASGRAWPGCVLQRLDDGNDGEIPAGAGRYAHARRFPRFSTGVGRTDLDDISRMDRLRTSSKWARNRRINNVEHHGAVSAWTVCAQLRGCSASHDRGEKAGLRGYV